MSLAPRLGLRQSQTLVMTPQLQQAAKLLALSNLELEGFISDALAANPLIAIEEGGDGRSDPDAGAEPDGGAASPEASAETTIDARDPGDGAPLDIAADAVDGDYDTGDGALRGRANVNANANAPGFGENDAAETTLADHLHRQIGPGVSDPALLFVARQIIDCLDEAGYLTSPLAEIAESLGIEVALAEAALAAVQALEPTGVGARDLAECLRLQAVEADRYDPCMAALIANLDLLAKGAFAPLRRMCGVDEDDLREMIAELRSYDPRPGLRIGGNAAPPVVPDLLVRPGSDGGWTIALNQRTLPRLVIDRSYYLQLRAGCATQAARGWLGERMADANWLVKALDQRQKTILKVAAEIVRRQDGFFRRGVGALIPLTLREVAEAIDMHESTISRVTSNKYVHCARGTFELKYFFSSGVAAEGGAASAETVKAEIKALIDGEDPNGILSDDALVVRLKERGYTLARRTVAKYRESIGLGSSVQRRRQKALEGAR